VFPIISFCDIMDSLEAVRSEAHATPQLVVKGVESERR
jgi:hypothetical protein